MIPSRITSRTVVLGLCIVVSHLTSVVRGNTSGITSDDFNACSLDTTLWQVINPLGDATFIVSGTGSSDATIAIFVPAGTPHDVWDDGNLAPRLMQPANNTDFDIEVKFDAPMLGGSQIQGVIIEQDESNFLRFDFHSTDVEQRILAATVVSGATGISEDFQSYASGANALDWLDTADNSSMIENDTLFQISDLAGNRALSTSSSNPDIHSHYVGAGSAGWSSYEFSGRMMATSSKSGIGVTFLSDYPNSDSYYRLRSNNGGSFHISPHPWPTATITGGTTDSGVSPTENQWYRFKIQLDDDGTQTLIRAKVWVDGSSEPEAWQIDCYDSSSARYTSGTVGVWSYKNGNKYWDDFEVWLPNAGVTTIEQDAAIAAGSPLYMSISRAGDVWTQEYSYDGITWYPSVTFEHVLSVSAVGPFVGNADAAPAFTGVVDYFFDRAAPIDPEDGAPPSNPGATLTVNIAGDGDVVGDPDESIYYCDELVTLTATPALGWLFQGWGGDLTGTEPVETVSMTATRVIDATFVPDDQPLVLSDISVNAGDNDALITWTTNKPATSSVAYGTTDAYELGSVGSSDYITSHAIQLTGLDPGVVHHFQITSVDGLGNPLSSSDRTFMTAVPGGFQSDDFNTCLLDTGLWQVVNPLGDATVTVGGIGSSDAIVAVTLPEGTSHDTWGNGNEAVRLMQAAENTDFEIEVKFDAPMAGASQIQGVLVEQDADNYLCFDFYSTDDENRILAAAVTGGTSPISHDFQDYSAGDDPIDWLDTGAKNSLVENDSLFKVLDVGADRVFGTTSTSNNIHSHYVGTGSYDWSAYHYTGRMMLSDANGGIGLTVFSDYPNSDSYYRLRRYRGVSFHVSPHPDGVVTISGGTTDTGVTPAANVWYLFKLEVEDTGTQTELRAKVWPEGSAEPAQWQVDCFDAHANRLTAGTVGLWSMGAGAKYWDDLQFGLLQADGTTVFQSSPITTGAPLYMSIAREGDQWTQRYSYDGETWLPSVTFEHAMTVSAVGPFVGNAEAAPAFTGLIDYFFNSAAPIVPEDGSPVSGPGTTLTVNATGNGNVVWEPDQSVYYCDEQVSLTATSALGWLFDGYSGDLVGTDPEQTVSMTQSYVIDATFVPDDRPLTIADVAVQVGYQDAQVTWTTNKPATSSVAYGTTAAYELGTVDSGAYVPSHSILLTGLAPLTEYHYQITSIDGLGNPQSTVDSVFTTISLGGFLSDDFNTCSLNTTVWQVVNPLGDATFTVSGIGSNDATVAISIPEGTAHDVGTDGNNAPRLMQAANDTDFEIKVKFDSAIIGSSQIQGVIIEQDGNNFLRCDFHSTHDENRIFAAVIEPGTGELSYDFESNFAGDDPADWLDTAAGNSMVEDNSLFKVFSVGGSMVFGTSSTAGDIHSHCVAAGSATWNSYEYTGRLMITDLAAGIGVTFLSDYPSSDSYYRLRSANGGSFHISPHPWPTASITGGTTDSGVAPAANQWYEFKVEVNDDGSQTLIRAKVWADGTSEPASWQIDCYDSSSSRHTAGTIGAWAYSSGGKYWDDLTVRMLESASDTTVMQDAPISAGLPLYMSIMRQGDTWTQAYSYDGMSWLPSITFEHAMTVNTVGPFVGNADAAPAFTGVVDYFFNGGSPIVPEDGPPPGHPGTTLTANVTGNGSVVWDPDQSVYYCDEVVTVTALPDPGWLFDHWTGDLSGSGAEQTLSMAASRSIEAIFIPDDRPLEITDINADVTSTRTLITWTTNKPATSSVAYGTTDSYELGSVDHSAYVTSHSVWLVGLVPLTEYHFQVTSVDGLGNSLSSADATFTTPVPGSFFSDDFNVCSIDTGLWQIVNPLGDATFALSGIGSDDATVAISLPAGTPHPAWGSGNNAPRLMQMANDSDFEIEVKFDTSVLSDTQTQGVIVEQDAENYLCFDFHRSNGTTRVRASGVEPGTGSLLYDFQNDSAGDDPADWLDTGANNSLVEDDSLFKVSSVGGSMAFGTSSTAGDIHSHYIGAGSSAWTSYEYTGRMMPTSGSGGIGVTFLSDYPNSDSYYRLRSTNGGSFHISPHPWPTASITGGTTSSGVAPVANQWYRFRIQLGDDGTRTLIQAKVWLDGTTEPTGWQIDCYDSSGSRYTAGTVGLWCYGEGDKYWDDLSFGLSNVGNASVKQDMPISAGSPLYMSISRQGDTWTQAYSYDGTTWLPSITFDHAMTVSAIGPFVGNGDAALASTGVIDYFFNRAIPITPEDGPPPGNPGTTLTTNVTGNGSVVANPDQSIYYCDETVTVIATPGGPGWLFDSWNGDLIGTDPEQTVSMTESRTIEAIFVTDDRPLEISDIHVAAGHEDAVVTWTTNKPATSSVAYGTTDSYELGDVGSGEYVTSHSILLTNLAILTEYHFQVTSEDGLGNSLSSSDSTFTTTVPGGFVSDDFNAFNLDLGIWDAVNPLGDATFVMLGANTPDAHLVISIPGGVAHPVATTGIQAPRIMQAANNTDFGLEVKFESAVTEQYQQQGVIVEQDTDTFLRIELYSDGTSNRFFAAAFDNGTMTVLKSAPVSPFTPWHMRVGRVGDQWTVDYSFDGANWALATAFTYPMTVTAVGPYVANEGSPAPAFTGIIDYFFNAAAPIDPEDGEEVVDTVPPNLMNIQTFVNENTVTITWDTDEPADSLVDYGETTSYELGPVSDASFVFSHTLSVYGLEPETTYNFRITSEDASGNASQSDNLVESTGVIDPGPTVEVWYGNTQEFGHIGTPQPWVNILGNASDSDGVVSLTYALNSGPEVPLNMGPNDRRLALPGDFNADLAFDDLLPGVNQLIIRAVDGLGKQSITPVQIINSRGPVWPLPYFVDWSGVSNINNVAQVVDGLWTIDGDSVRPVVLDYDRLIAIGDLLWEDYEVRARITVHALDPFGYAAPSYGPAVGLLLRWPGHSDDGDQPMQGVYPLGAIGLFRWTTSSERFEIFGNKGGILAAAPETDVLQLGVDYIWKMRAESAGSDVLYKLKVWELGQNEPVEWKLIGDQPAYSDPGSGSLLLLAHHVDASFGDISVLPGPFDNGDPPAISNVQSTTGDSSAVISWDTNYPATSEVAHGLTETYELGTVEDASLVENHTITLTGLTQGTLYHYQITSVVESGIGVSSADLTFTTTVNCDVDSDSDGVKDCEDGCPTDGDKIEPGLCGCGVSDADSDSDGIPDCGVLDFAFWLDTSAGNSLVEDDSLFGVFNVDGEDVFGTTSTATNIHSHYIGSGSDAWAGSTYEYIGRMIITDSRSGIGLTILSDYPDSDAYYRLRRYNGTSFHMSPHPDGVVTMSGGTTDTGVVPVADVWYSFKIQVVDAADKTEVRAKVWPAGSTEPAPWQVDCFDAHANRLRIGTVGLWSMGIGEKYWADLEVHMPF